MERGIGDGEMGVEEGNQCLLHIINAKCGLISLVLGLIGLINLGLANREEGGGIGCD